jgi:peptide chain release factor subunit 1
VITRAELERLKDLHDPSGQLISLYLHVDRGRTDEEHTIRLKNLLREAEDSIARRHAEGVDSQTAEVLARIRRVFRDDAADFRHGAAVFATPDGGVWEIVELPGVVGTSVTVDAESNIAPLVKAFQDDAPYCTCIISRDDARILVGQFDVLEDVERLTDDDVPGQHDQGGWSQARFERHIEDHVHRHFKHVAQHLFDMRDERPFRHLVLGGPEEVVSAFASGLHPYIHERIVGEIRILMDANINDIAQASRNCIDSWRRATKDEVVDTLLSEALSHDLGVHGLGDTLQALHRLQVKTLVVDHQFHAAGVRCNVCGSLDRSAGSDGQCRYCGGPVTEVENLLPGIVGRAFQQRADIEFIDDDEQQGRLGRLGGIGAILRFKVETA